MLDDPTSRCSAVAMDSKRVRSKVVNRLASVKRRGLSKSQ